MPVNGVLEYLWFRDNDPWWATLLRAVTLIALVVLFAFKGMHKVPSGSRALRTRFNRVVHYRRDVYDRLGYTIHGRGEAKVVSRFIEAHESEEPQQYLPQDQDRSETGDQNHAHG